MTSVSLSDRRKRELLAGGAWVTGVVLFGLVLWLAMFRGTLRAMDYERHRDLDLFAQNHNVQWLVGNINQPAWAPGVPWLAIAGFAILGATCLALAWAGHRAVALALPLVVTLLTLGPSVIDMPGSSGLVPHPFGDAATDYAAWSGLVYNWASGTAVSRWPYLLGAAVQIALVVVPVLLMPRRTAATQVPEVVALVAPLLGLVVVVQLFWTTSLLDLRQLPPGLLGLTVVLSSGLIATGAGRRWVRLLAAALLPGALAAFLLPLMALPGWSALVGFPHAVWVALSVVTTAFVVALQTWRGRQSADTELDATLPAASLAARP